MIFSDVSGNTGILQQTRKLMRVDSTQWPTINVVNSVNNYLDALAGYAIGADKRFQWDDTNHSALPEGTDTLTINVTDYSFLTDQQLNSIVSLTGVSIKDANTGLYNPLTPVDRSDTGIDLSTFGTQSGTPTSYDKIADNVIRLDFKPPATVSSGIKYSFQRVPSYFVSTDTTKSPGFSPLLHRGFVIAAAYDGALTLGLSNLQALSVEFQKEQQKMIKYFEDRNRDQRGQMTPNIENYK